MCPATTYFTSSTVHNAFDLWFAVDEGRTPGSVLTVQHARLNCLRVLKRQTLGSKHGRANDTMLHISLMGGIGRRLRLRSTKRAHLGQSDRLMVKIVARFSTIDSLTGNGAVACISPKLGYKQKIEK